MPFFSEHSQRMRRAAQRVGLPANRRVNANKLRLGVVISENRVQNPLKTTKICTKQALSDKITTPKRKKMAKRSSVYGKGMSV